MILATSPLWVTTTGLAAARQRGFLMAGFTRGGPAGKPGPRTRPIPPVAQEVSPVESIVQSASVMALLERSAADLTPRLQAIRGPVVAEDPCPKPDPTSYRL